MNRRGRAIKPSTSKRELIRGFEYNGLNVRLYRDFAANKYIAVVVRKAAWNRDEYKFVALAGATEERAAERARAFIDSRGRG